MPKCELRTPLDRCFCRRQGVKQKWKLRCSNYTINSHYVKSLQIRSFLVRIFLYLSWIRIQSISPYSVRMRENTDEKKLRIWTLFRQSYLAQYPISIPHENLRKPMTIIKQVFHKNNLRVEQFFVFNLYVTKLINFSYLYCPHEKVEKSSSKNLKLFKKTLPNK